MSNSWATTQGKAGAEWKNLRLKTLIKPSDMSSSLFFPIPFLSYCLCLLEQLQKTRTYCHTMPWPACSTSIHSLHFCLHCCKIILYLPHTFIFFCKLHLRVTNLKTQWELIMAWRCLRYSSQERWRTAPGESLPYLIDILLLLQLPLALCSGFALWTSARYFCVNTCWLFTSTFYS